jgi:hypothetical protein
MRNPRRLVLRLVWLASLTACASLRPVFDVRPINDGLFNPEWPELLRTRYGCEGAVVGAALQAVREGHTYPYVMPRESDLGTFVCDLVGGMWPVRVRAFQADSGNVEQWEFRPPFMSQQGNPATSANIYGPTPDPGRPALSGNNYGQAFSVFFEGPTPHLLRVYRFR